MMNGVGSYAKVREAVDSITHRRVAIKIMKRRKLKRLPGGENSVTKEVEMLSKLRHVNIVELIDYFTVDENEKMYLLFYLFIYFILFFYFFKFFIICYLLT